MMARKAEEAYRRKDQLEKRVNLMQQLQNQIESPNNADLVVQISMRVA